MTVLTPSPEAIHTVRRARRRYRCENPWCERYPLGVDSLFIQPGDLYTRSALPPGAEPLYAEGWSVARFHFDCLPVATATPDGVATMAEVAR